MMYVTCDIRHISKVKPFLVSMKTNQKLTFPYIDVKSFSNSFEGVLGDVRKSRGRGGPLFLVSLHFYDKIFKIF
jgi:hypothetical protein